MLDIFEGLELDIDELNRFDDETDDEDILVEDYDEYDTYVEFDDALQDRLPSGYKCSTTSVDTAITYGSNPYPELTIKPNGYAEINFGDDFSDMSEFWSINDWDELKTILTTTMNYIQDCEDIVQEWETVVQDYPQIFGGDNNV